jgi:hypothetical protein
VAKASRAFYGKERLFDSGRSQSHNRVKLHEEMRWTGKMAKKDRSKRLKGLKRS